VRSACDLDLDQEPVSKDGDADQKSGSTVISRQTAPSDPIPGDHWSSQPALKRQRGGGE
jgi:hypothetical protein